MRDRANGICEWCGSSRYVQAHHIIGKQYKPLRFELLNGVALCAGKCHKFTPHAVHQNPILFVEWLKSARPESFKFLLKFDLEKEYKEDLNKIYLELSK